ncbi:MAG: hypothetical protein AAFX06_33980, partial [Planctomycetota bacterium]
MAKSPFTRRDILGVGAAFTVPAIASLLVGCDSPAGDPSPPPSSDSDVSVENDNEPAQSQTNTQMKVHYLEIVSPEA